ncbi:unnamed protein product, partial [Allacma fusca]
ARTQIQHTKFQSAPEGERVKNLADDIFSNLWKLPTLIPTLGMDDTDNEIPLRSAKTNLRVEDTILSLYFFTPFVTRVQTAKDFHAPNMS